VFARKIGIDIGTSTMQVFVRGEGIVADEPSVAAVDLRDQRLRAVGRPALELAGREDVPCRLVRPISRGAMVDGTLVARILVHVVARTQGRRRLFRPEVMLCVPSAATSAVRRTMIDAAIDAGARQAWLIEAPLAGALGLGLPVAQSKPHAICDLGGGLMQVAVISFSSVAASHMVAAGGEQLDAALVELLRQRMGLVIDQSTAEALKMAVGAAQTLAEPLTAEIAGTTVTSDELIEAVQAWLGTAVETVRRVLDQTPQRLADEVAERGFFLTGGGALLRGVDRYLSAQTGIPFRVAEEPRTCAVRGTRRALGEFDVIHRRQLDLASR
jgi:rod shape-determining protein MreB and related proteins